MTSIPLLEAQGITKRFGTLLANDSVDLVVQPGEIHALLGENGAGKSTLVKILYGSLEPTDGEILWKGKKVNLKDPAEARKLGIGMVFQHFSLFDSMTVVENIALALPKGQKITELSKRIEQVSNEYGLPLKADNLVADLSVGERQRIEIVRCLLQDPQLIIMDEPTSVLTLRKLNCCSKRCSVLQAKADQFCILATVWKRCSASAIPRPFCVTASWWPNAHHLKKLRPLSQALWLVQASKPLSEKRQICLTHRYVCVSTIWICPLRGRFQSLWTMSVLICAAAKLLQLPA